MTVNTVEDNATNDLIRQGIARESWLPHHAASQSDTASSSHHGLRSHWRMVSIRRAKWQLTSVSCDDASSSQQTVHVQFKLWVSTRELWIVWQWDHHETLSQLCACWHTKADNRAPDCMNHTLFLYILTRSCASAALAKQTTVSRARFNFRTSITARCAYYEDTLNIISCLLSCDHTI